MNKAFESELKQVMEHLKAEIKNIRTGRATPQLVEDVQIEVYGTRTPLKQVANIVAPDASSIVIEPWDKNNVQAVEKGIQESDLGLSPVNEGQRIRLKLPPLTEERRQELVKVLHEKVEEAKISVRNNREDALKKLKADGLSEDEEKRERDEVQKLVDAINKEIDAVSVTKEEELLAVGS